MAVFGGMPAVFIVTILLQCVVSSNDFAVETTGKVVQQHFLFPEVYNLNCINTTLSTDDYEMFPNSTLFVKKYDMFLNSSGYVQVNDTITICKPKWIIFLDKLTVGFYFSFIIFMTHAQTPIALCFGQFAKLFLTFVCLMPTATLFSLGTASTYSDLLDKCVVTAAVLAFINVSTLGWMTLLSSNYIVRFLESRYCIEITESKVVLKKLTGIAHMGLVLATILSLHSFIMIVFGVVKRLYGVDFIDKIEGDKMMILFAPPILLFLVINFMLSLLNYGDYNACYNSTSSVRENIKLRHRKYFVRYMGSICIWLFGTYSFMYNCSLLQYGFFIATILLPLYWMRELLSLNIFTYDVPVEEPQEEDEGYTVLFKLGKKVVKLDFDYNAATARLH